MQYIKACFINNHLFRIPSQDGLRMKIKLKLVHLSSARMSARAASLMSSTWKDFPVPGAILLIRDDGLNTWGKDYPIDKFNIIKKMVSYKPRMFSTIPWRDEISMLKYLDYVSISSLQYPPLAQKNEYVPLGASLLGFLNVNQEQMEAWRYPQREEIRGWKETMVYHISCWVL